MLNIVALTFAQVVVPTWDEGEALIVPVPEIVVTAALQPAPVADTPASVTVIGRRALEALDEPLALDLLRLAPGVSLASSGPPGSQAQVRIRGSEANHTLLLIDGIRFNDPATGNEARFELLSGDGAGRIELVRGPQSALYGAEAIGGVVAVRTGRPDAGPGVSGTAEAGGRGFRRLAAETGFGDEKASFGMYGGYQESDGIDSFSGAGDRDGYNNLTFGASSRFGREDGFSVSGAARFTQGRSEFDGLDPATFARTDTLDSTRNRIGAGRVALSWGDAARAPFHVEAGASLLASTNRNRLAGDPLNRTSGRRTVFDALASAGFDTGALSHRLIVAGDYERERFVAEDQNFFGSTNQRRSRDRGAVVGELRSKLGGRIVTDIAVRHDSFDGFRDATTVRAGVIGRVSAAVSLVASYGEGIARPTFFDLFGFFPGSFVGNPDLRLERSRGGEIGVRFERGPVQFGVTGFRQKLKDEIVPTFDPRTFLSGAANASGTSQRKGVEVEGSWRALKGVDLLASYTFLDADEREVAGGAAVQEIRRPRHSASLAATAAFGPLSAGLSLAYVGKRIDTDFGAFPAVPVRLGDYVLGSARVGYDIAPGVELFARMSNLFDARYQDVVGYATQGRTAYGGVRLRYGD